MSHKLRNKAQLIGYICKHPQIKTTEKGQKSARFYLITHESYHTQTGERVTENQYHSIVAWGKLAELAEKQLKPEKGVAVEGKLVTRSYTDKEGIKRQVTEIVAREILLLSSKSS